MTHLPLLLDQRGTYVEATLVSVEELAARLPFVMDDDEEREAEGALEDLSDDARSYGRATWLTQATTPRQVKNLVRRAAARHMKNYDGFTTSRAGDEAVGWTDRGEQSGSAYFTQSEIKLLRGLSGRGGFASVPLSGYQDTRGAVGYVPAAGGGDPFPMYAGDGPW